MSLSGIKVSCVVHLSMKETPRHLFQLISLYRDNNVMFTIPTFLPAKHWNLYLIREKRRSIRLCVQRRGKLQTEFVCSCNPIVLILFNSRLRWKSRVRKFIRQIRINPLMDESSSFVDPTFAAHVWITTPIPFCDMQVKISTWKNSQDDSKSVVISKNWLRLLLSPVLAIMWAWGNNFGY